MRVDAVSVHRVDDFGDEVGVLELNRRHVEADVQPEFGLPSRCQGQSLVEDPGSHGNDEARPLGDRNEICCRDFPELGMMPANQRFGAGDLTAAQVDIGHVHKTQLAVVECCAELASVGEVFAGHQTHGRVEDANLALCRRAFASYIATSASRSRLLVDNPGAATATPTLASTEMRLPPNSTGSLSSSISPSATLIALSIPPRSSSRMANSSPPNLATVSPVPADRRIRPATDCRMASPTACP